MNVVHIDGMDTLALPGGGKRRGAAAREAGITIANNENANLLPKYGFNGVRRQPLVDTARASTGATPGIFGTWPKRHQQRSARSEYPPTTASSSFGKSASRRPRLASGVGQTPAGGGRQGGNSTSDPEHCFVIAITSGRGDARGEVGMAAIDVHYPHMILCQMSDCNTYINTLTKIHAFDPVEIIMPDTMCETSIYGNALYRAIKDKFASITITPLARMHFHDGCGIDRIKTHCADEFSSVQLFIKQKYYALAATSALLKYVEFIQHVAYAPKCMRIDFQGSQNTAMIDVESARSLELVESITAEQRQQQQQQQRGSRTFSLFGALDRCSTPMGRRLLRVSILQPPCDLERIKERQECVAEFVSNRSFHSILKPVIKRMYGASRLLNLAMITAPTVDSVQAAERNLNYVLLLKNMLDMIPELRSIIVADGRAAFFQRVVEDLGDSRYELMKEQISSVVHPDARSVMGYTSLNMQRCFSIRSGINDMLDVARQTYCELIDDMQHLVEQLSRRYNLELSLGCNASLGYHITMNTTRSSKRRGAGGHPPPCISRRADRPPDVFIQVHRVKNTIYMTTEFLAVLGRHCRDACQELHLMCNALLSETLSRLRRYVGCLFKLCDNVAQLDLFVSMAEISRATGWVLPTFGATLRIRESRHPVMDISGTDAPVPNDVAASSLYNFHTITGANMSGKSVYLKQIVLSQIIAQIGTYVPARSAEFRIADRIFCRMSTPRQDIQSNSSSFVLEMKESQYILRSLTGGTALIVLDELCRGTTVEEGTSLAWAICERLLGTSAFVFSATHFLYLTRLSELYRNVKNHYMETRAVVDTRRCCSSSSSSSSSFSARDDARLIYTHRLREGVAPPGVCNYGIALARWTGLPNGVVSNATIYANEISKSVKGASPAVVAAVATNDDQHSTATTHAWKNILYHCLEEMSILLDHDEFCADTIVELVNRLEIPSVLGRLTGHHFDEAKNINSSGGRKQQQQIRATETVSIIQGSSSSSSSSSSSRAFDEKTIINYTISSMDPDGHVL